MFILVQQWAEPDTESYAHTGQFSRANSSHWNRLHFKGMCEQPNNKIEFEQKKPPKNNQ